MIRYKLELKKAQFKKLLTRQFGSIKVETKLLNDSVAPGEMIEGLVELSCKTHLKEVEKIIISLVQTYQYQEDRYANLALEDVELFLTEEQKSLKEVSIPFALSVPLYTPYTTPHFKSWVQTDINLLRELNPRDIDFIQINKHPFIHKVNEVLTDRLKFKETGREEIIYFGVTDPNSKLHIMSDKQRRSPIFNVFPRRSVPAIQEIEYRPSEEFKGKFREIELVYDIFEHRADVYVELQFMLDHSDGGKFKRSWLALSEKNEEMAVLHFSLDEMNDLDVIETKFYTLLKNAEKPNDD